jgi:UDP-GlcNAc:undecaprenyl-phosphate GlcNAc-1-phosphate transferase
VKLVVQLIVAALVVYFSRRLHWTNIEAVNIFITIFWLVGITNAINLLDNMDGLAGGISAIACIFLTVTLLLNGQMEQALLPAILGAAVLGFLVFNFSPASIFMGDTGSLFLGFVLGNIALLSNNDRLRNLGSVLLTPVLILLIPIFDTCVVTVTRKLSGRPISQGGRDHTSHRLVALGISERRAVLLLYSLAVAAGLLSLLIRNMRLEFFLLLIPIFALGLLSAGIWLAKVHVYEKGPRFSENTILSAIGDFPYKRRILEITLDVALTILAFYGAFVLRFDGQIPLEQFLLFRKMLPLVIGIQMLCLLIGRVYHGLWRYVDTDDMLKVVRAVTAGSALSAAVICILYDWKILSVAVFVLFPLLLAVGIGLSRFSFRLLQALIVGGTPAQLTGEPVLIYGAGDRGEILLRELRGNSEFGYAPVGFIDDDPLKAGKLIHGCRISATSKLPELVAQHGIRVVLVSSLKISENELDQLRLQGLYLKRMSIRLESDLGASVGLQRASNF